MTRLTSFIDKIAGLKFWQHMLVCLLIGIVGIFGHAPYFFWPVAIFMFALLIRLIVIAPTPGRAFWTAQWFGTGYFAGQVYWVAAAFSARGEEFVYIMPFLLGGLALILPSFWSLGSLFYKKYLSQSHLPYLMVAVVLFFGEWMRGHLFGGFPWDLPGYIFEAGSAMSQSASVLGIYGLSYGVLIAAALLAWACWENAARIGIIMSVLLAANFGFGVLRLQTAEVQFVDNVNLRIVAVPFSQKEKLGVYGVAPRIVQEHINLTASPGLENATHIIWPEGALYPSFEDCGDVRRMTQLRSIMGAMFRSTGSKPPVWLVNSNRVIGPESCGDAEDVYNSTAVMSFDRDGVGEVLSVSDKKRLVPFGEIIPGGEFIEKLGARIVASNVSSFTPAKIKTISDIPGLPRGSIQICYEAIFSGLTPRPQDGKVEWILNQSNDAWFGPDIGPQQHANIARYRAIEERVPVIRSAANGYSGVIDPYGRFIEFAAPGEKRAIDSRLPRAIGKSFPFKWINRALFLLTLMILIIPPFRFKRSLGANG